MNRKKGRVLLRKLLGQVVFSLTRKDDMLGEYYHRERQEFMPGHHCQRVIIIQTE